MPTPSEFSPVILFAADLKPIYDTLVAAGRADLAAIIETQTTRSPAEQRYLDARPELDDNEFDFDEVPIVSEGEHGAYLSCWVWVSSERAAEVAGDALTASISAEDRARESARRQRRLNRRISRLKPAAKNALLRDLASILYGEDLDPHSEWTQDNIEQVADRMDAALKLRGEPAMG